MTELLRAEGIVKRFDSLPANDHIDFRVRRGEIHALLGENGAGKSTLLNVLYGVFRPDEGEIFVKGERASIQSTRDAIVKYGIGKVSQHSDLVPTFTVSENILYKGIPRKYGFLIDRKAMKAKVQELLAATGYRLNPDAPVETLSVGEQHNVELLKVLYQDAEIIFLDETSALLAPQEVNDLFDLLRSLASKGRAIVFVTHKMYEALLCDRITVLRNGKVVLAADRSELSQERLLQAMFGEEISSISKERAPGRDFTRPVLQVRGLRTGDGKQRSDLKDVSFVLHAGEILGVAGVAGNGQKQLLEVVTGSETVTEGKIILAGKDITGKADSHRLRREKLLAYVPEERRSMGSFLDLCIADNAILGEGRKAYFFPRWFRDSTRIREFSSDLIREYSVRTAGIHALAGSLSGGNLQKLIVAREFSLETDLVVVAQPSYGLDFKTTEFVHAKLLEKKAQGKAVLLVSKDLDEIIKLSDTIAVMFEGRLHLLPSADAGRERIGRIMVGLDGETDRCR